MGADVTVDDDYYAPIPEWVLDADISAQAVRLYGVLRRYADKATLLAHPTRATLAERLKVKDQKVVDRAVKELVGVGALTVIPRWRDTENNIAYARDDAHQFQTSNAYRVFRRPSALPFEGGVGGASATPPGGASTTPRGAEKGDNQQSGEPQSPEPHLPPTPTAAAAQEEGRARGALDFNRGKRRATPPADPQNQVPPQAESFEDAAEALWDERASEAFMAFWDAYPKQTYPESALKVWRRKKLDRIADRVINGARRYAADPNRVEQYTAAPTTWLEGGGWDNGPEPRREAQSKAEAEQRHYNDLFAQAAQRASVRDLGALEAIEAAGEDRSLRQVGGSW